MASAKEKKEFIEGLIRRRDRVLPNHKIIGEPFSKKLPKYTGPRINWDLVAEPKPEELKEIESENEN